MSVLRSLYRWLRDLIIRRMLLAGFAIAGVFAMMLWGDLGAYHRQTVVQSKIIGFELQCTVIDRRAGRGVAPKIIRLPCREAEAMTGLMDGVVVAESRTRLVTLEFTTPTGDVMTTTVPASPLRIGSDAEVGDVVEVAFDGSQPADRVGLPRKGVGLLAGLISVVFMFAVMLSAARKHATEPQSHRDKLTVVSDQLKAMIEKMACRKPAPQSARSGLLVSGSELLATIEMARGPLKPRVAERTTSHKPTSNPRAGATRKPSVQRASRWF